MAFCAANGLSATATEQGCVLETISTLEAACSPYKQIHNSSKDQLPSGSRAPLFFSLALHFA